MPGPAARLGDTTVHGGVIVAGAPTVMIGGKPAARLTDMHTCPMQTPATPPIPHVGGPITGPGVATVLICGMPAACVGDMATCTGPPDSIAPPGCPTVILGSGGGGGGGAGSGGGSSDKAKSQEGKKQDADTTKSDDDEAEEAENHYLDVKFVDKGGKPIAGVGYTVKAPNNDTTNGALSGQVKRMGVKEGDYEIQLKAITKAEWSETEAAVGDKVKLTAETAGIDSGEKATLAIFIKDSNFADHRLKVIETKVDGDKIEEEWQLEIDDDLLDDQEQKEGKRYSHPTFYFTAAAAGVTSRSGILTYKDFIELELKDEEGNAAANVKYKVYLRNGVIREGALDSNGYAKVKNVPPGKVDVAFDVRDSD